MILCFSDMPPPGICPPIQADAGGGWCSCCRRSRRRRRIWRYKRLRLCGRHLAARIAADWRKYRLRYGLGARGRLPDGVVEDAIESAWRLLEADYALRGVQITQ